MAASQKYLVFILSLLHLFLISHSSKSIQHNVPKGPNPIGNKSPPPHVSFMKRGSIFNSDNSLNYEIHRKISYGLGIIEPPISHSFISIQHNVPKGPNPTGNKSPPPHLSFVNRGSISNDDNHLNYEIHRKASYGSGIIEPPISHSFVSIQHNVPKGPNPTGNKSPPPHLSFVKRGSISNGDNSLNYEIHRKVPSGSGIIEPPTSRNFVSIQHNVPMGPNPKGNKCPLPHPSSEINRKIPTVY